ncbi:MAG: type III-A CRISPR-associated protein Cas10/Csm1, partial [Clostridia bacterium]|nr:type III-A CRISPR-associated protein Cas10/Csm1 [Clostridia bacterium]
MTDTETKVVFGALLHDAGKVVYRSGRDGRAHSISGADFLKGLNAPREIVDCAQYHHKQQLRDARLPSSSIAYVVYLADNLSSGSDRREVEGDKSYGFDRMLAQASIFNLLMDNREKRYLPATTVGPKPPSQELKMRLAPEDYSRILSDLESGLRGTPFTQEYVNSVIEVLEACLSFVPCSTQVGEVPDISLFDHMKITAAYAACIWRYCAEQGLTDLRAALFDGEKDFIREKAFLLASVDISGIQPFIYGISSSGALKNLRSRSFYLEVLLEHCMDELLTCCGMCRVNLLYTGGGRAYLLLPNTRGITDEVQRVMQRLNECLIDMFDADLFIAHGLAPCSADELMASSGAGAQAFNALFASVSEQISRQKLRRYTPVQALALNHRHPSSSDRECVACGRVSQISDDGLCPLCQGFVDISRTLLKPEAVFITAKGNDGLPLPCASGEQLSMSVTSPDAAKRKLSAGEDIIRLYSKNLYRSGLSLSTKLWMGDLAATDEQGQLKTFDELAQMARGHSRIAVLRADVDNLGTVFARGFKRQDEEDPYRYVTLSRSSALSRSMSLFFKYYINDVLKTPVFSIIEPSGRDGVTIVYSGGDDLFLVGAWDQVLCAAVDLRNAFREYSGGTLTLSAGIGVYESGYPLAAMAREVGELESDAKSFSQDGRAKDAVALFGRSLVNDALVCEHVYRWDTLTDKVIGEKLTLLSQLFNARPEMGNAFLYNILALLREAKSDRLNIARLAYLLARHECP